MKKMPVFLFYICSASILINVYPAITGIKTNIFASLSLISSTIAWLSYLFSLYFFGVAENKRTPLIYLNILLIASIIFPLYDVFRFSRENIQSASNGLLPGLYIFMNYTSRISLLLFSISIIARKEILLRIAMISLATLIFISFSTCVYELFVFMISTEGSTLFNTVRTVLDPIAIISTFVLQIYLIINRRVVIEGLLQAGFPPFNKYS